tara:strand:+ start:6742 stop:6999 length:258 start_codon:yes stop_codon:yes gene_type:complete
MELKEMPLSDIAQMVREDWTNPYFGAVPYLDAMATMESIEDKYFMDDGDDIVIYFLANAQTWRGEVARTVKKELNRRFQDYKNNK